MYSKTRLQIIRWNKSREASTESEEKQKGLNVKERHGVTGLSQPSYSTV